MATKVMKLIVLMAVGLSCLYHEMETASVSSTETTESVIDDTTTESTSTCTNPECPSRLGSFRHCSLACDPTGCTPPRCVCGLGYCLVACPRKQCPAGATLYRPPYYCTCQECVCLPKRCATCDPKNTTTPNFPVCDCPTCQCIDGQCINNSTTTDTTTESLTTPV
ncbi:hypothetical protein CBL_00251 [Carabus blaptoides fortunei]